MLISFLVLVAFAFGAAATPIELTLRNGTNEVNVSYNPTTTCVVIIDMWSYHWCKTTTFRAGSLVPRLNLALDVFRAAGTLVVHSPTDAAGGYDGWPQREAVFQVPMLEGKKVRNKTFPKIANYSGTPCMCGGSGHWDHSDLGEARMNPTIRIDAVDYIVGGVYNPGEFYSLLKAKGIKTILYAGIAENMCVQAKAQGIQNMYNFGFDTILLRDLTDAFTGYDPSTYAGPGLGWLSPDWGTRNVTASIERQGIAWTAAAGDWLAKLGKWPRDPVDPVRLAPWGSAARPHITDDPIVAVAITSVCDAHPELSVCTAGVILRYTVDGSDPTFSSPVVPHGPLPVELPVLTNPPTGVVVTACGFTTSGEPLFASSSSVLIRRPLAELPQRPAGAIGLGEAPLVQLPSDDMFARPPRVNQSWRGTTMMMRSKNYTEGLGLWAPSHATFNAEKLHANLVGKPEIALRLALAVGIDEWCLHPPAPYACHDIAEFTAAIVRVYADGALLGETPVLRMQGLPWVFDVAIPASTRLVRVVAKPSHLVNKPQDAYDYVDLVGHFYAGADDLGKRVAMVV